jgi:hypothetical protein
MSSPLDHLREIHARGPVRSAGHHPLAELRIPGRLARLNRRLAVGITGTVGTMWCAYAFAALSLAGMPLWAPPWLVQAVQWTSQNFIQLVLLSVILVGQSVISLAADTQRERDHEILGHTLQVLDGQNRELSLQTVILRALAMAFPEVRKLIPPEALLPTPEDPPGPHRS